MNKNIRSTFTLLLAFTCLSAVADIERPEPDLIGQQHLAVISLSAFFYCGLGQWPSDIEQLKEFQEVNEKSVGVELFWSWLQGSEFNYSATERFYLVSETPDGNGGLYRVDSGQDPPICSDGNIELRGAFVNL